MIHQPEKTGQPDRHHPDFQAGGGQPETHPPDSTAMKILLVNQMRGFAIPAACMIATASISAAPVVEDGFDAANGAPPAAAAFEWGGEAACNGAGVLSLQTWSVNESWLVSKAAVTPTHGRALVFRIRAYTYAEHWDPGVYGNQQPRGLRSGISADECAEFFTISRTSIGMRVRNNGSESNASIDFPAGVDSMHNYEITLLPGMAVFSVDGGIAAAFSTDVPDGPLNVHVATSDGGAGNVPVTIDHVSYSTRSTTPVLFLGDSFDGSAGAAPDASAFQWDGEAQQSGTGSIHLNTQNVDHSWLRSKAAFAPATGQTLRFAMRAYAYAEEHWSPGVYGDHQPRGLRVGNDPDNAAEFFSESLQNIGARVCRNGVESTKVVPIPGGVNRLTDLEILLAPDLAVFLVDGTPVATFTENIPDGPLNVHCSTYDGGGVGNVPVGIEEMSLSLMADPPVVLSDDPFDGTAGTPPDPSVYEWTGEVTRDGSGRMALQTWAVHQSSLRGKTGIIPTPERTLVMTARLSAPGGTIPGDGQPRGLRVGDDPDNAVEFYSVSQDTIGMRCRNGGEETTTTATITGGIDVMHDYEIRVSPGKAVFHLDGTMVGTITTNLPSGALNPHIATDDGNTANAAVRIDHLSFSVVQPPPVISSISPPSGIPGTVVVIEGTGFLEVSSVTFGGISAASFTVESSTRITAVVPEGFTTGPVAIGTVGGSGSGDEDFILKQPQTIAFDALPDKRIDDGAFGLAATSSSGLAVSYESSDPSIATVDGNTVTLTGRGSVTITASQDGDVNYLPATPVARTFYVAGLPPVIQSTVPSGSVIASATEGDSLGFKVTATDPEAGDVLTHTWFISRDGGATWQDASASGNDVVLTIPHDTVLHPATSLGGGMARVKVVVADAYRGETSHTWTATTVADRNRLPGFQREPGQGSWAWRATNTSGAPQARNHPTEVWTGSKAIFWGGSVGSDSMLNNGGIYDPLTDSWKPVSLTNAPPARFTHTAIWTGTRMIVWGGDQSGWSYSTSRLNSGGIYDPSKDSWTATTTTNAPLARARHTAVWTGSRMIVWGGTINTGSYYTTATGTGGIYNPETNSWTPVTMTGAPTRRMGHHSAWTGTRMLVWGGQRDGDWTYIDTDTGGLYDPETDSWTPMSTVNAPPASIGSSSVWTGSRFIVWGGGSASSPNNLGWSYDPATDQWTSISNLNAPPARFSYEEGGDAIWTGNRMLVWGGIASTSNYTGLLSGGLYNPDANTWRSMETLGTHSSRISHAMMWAGTAAIVWAGSTTSNSLLNTGAVYAAAPDVTVGPAAPLPGQELSCTVAEGVLDPDTEDQPNLVHEFTWLCGGNVRLVQSQTSPTATLPAGTTAAGEVWTCRVRILDPSGGATPASEGLPVTIQNSAMAQWTASSFAAEELDDPSVVGPMACPAGDNIPNLMKYALALPPMENGTSRMPTASTEDDHLTLTFRQNKQATDLTFTVQACSNLNTGDWNPAGSEVSRRDKGSYWEVTVRDTQPVSASTRRFMRLHVRR